MAGNEEEHDWRVTTDASAKATDTEAFLRVRLPTTASLSSIRAPPGLSACSGLPCLTHSPLQELRIQQGDAAEASSGNDDLSLVRLDAHMPPSSTVVAFPRRC